MPESRAYERHVRSINSRVRSSSIVFVIRFSHLSRKTHSFRQHKNLSLKERAAVIFDDERLRYRFYLFEKYLISSLDAQFDQSFSVILRCSPLLPDYWKKRLLDIADCRDYIYLNFVAPQDNVDEAEIAAVESLLPERRGPIITARIDDDDGIGSDYVARLAKYLKGPFIGFAVSFSKGFYILEDRNRDRYKLISVRRINNSCGLALVGRRRSLSRIISTLPVNHLRIDNLFPTIVDSSRHMFLMTAHGHQDTSRSSNRLLAAANWLDADEVKAKVGERFSQVHFEKLSYDF